MNPFKDNFGQEVNVGDFIMYAVNTRMRIGLVDRVVDDKSLRAYYCGYAWDYIGSGWRPILKKQIIHRPYKFVTKISGKGVLAYLYNVVADPKEELSILSDKYTELTGKNIQNIKWEVLDGVRV